MYTGLSAKTLFVFSITVVSMFSQIRVSPGFDLGTPLTDTLISNSSTSSSGASSSYNRYNSVTKRLLAGPTIRLELPSGLGLEFDALYQRVNFDNASNSLSPGSYSNSSFQQVTANRWEFPLLLQYSHNAGKVSPFVEAGPTISAIVGGRSQYTSTTINPPSAPSTNSSTGAVAGQTTAGVTLGGGIAVPAAGHHLRAEVRFSHWFSPGYATANALLGTPYLIPNLLVLPAGSGPFVLHANEATILLGFSF